MQRGTLIKRIALSGGFCSQLHVRQQLVDRGLDSEAKDLENRFQQDLTFLVEDVLGFGLSAGSNIAQRLSSAVAQAIVAIFAEEDTQYILDSAETDDQRAWIEDRRTLSSKTGRNEMRFIALDTYTDDSAITAVGADRALSHQSTPLRSRLVS